MANLSPICIACSDYGANSFLAARKQSKCLLASSMMTFIELDERFFMRIKVVGELPNRVQLVQKEAEIIILNDDDTVLCDTPPPTHTHNYIDIF